MSSQRAGNLTDDAVVRAAPARAAATSAATSSQASPAAPPATASPIWGAAPEQILASIADGLISVDNEWRLVYVNPAAQRMWNRDPREVLGRPIHEALDISPDNPFRALYDKS